MEYAYKAYAAYNYIPRWQVARGYLGAEELTRTKFYTSTSSQGEIRWFRSGDLGRWVLPLRTPSTPATPATPATPTAPTPPTREGAWLEILGRKDLQVVCFLTSTPATPATPATPTAPTPLHVKLRWQRIGMKDIGMKDIVTSLLPQPPMPPLSPPAGQAAHGG